MANHMAEVAKMLGVKLGERFKLSDANYDYVFDYYFSEDGIKIDKEGMGCEPNLLKDLICGKYIIKRKPWKPKYGEEYFCVTSFKGAVGSTVWRNILMDITFYKLGNCYRTREEAEANRDKWVKFYTSDEVLEVQLSENY